MISRFMVHVLIFLVFSLLLAPQAFAGEEQHGPAGVSHESGSEASHSESGEKAFEPGKMIVEHISDSHEWHFFTVKKKDGSAWHATVFLPVILFTPGEGLSVFNYGKLHHHGTYKAFSLDQEHHIVRTDGSRFIDLSITKNVMQMLIAVALMLLVFISAGRKAAKEGTVAPRGVRSAVEVIVIFIRDEVAKPMLGHQYMKYLPYLLTLFFFIWINNLIGLFPGAANVTGNIAVTATLAALTFILMMTGSTRYYWGHLFNPPGVPTAVKFLLVPIEFISNIFVKPFALMIRLFANMLAGHLIVLSFLSLIFIFAAMNLAAGIGASVFSIAFSVFIYLLELLVAALQAYIFTILSALFIGETIASHSHGEEHKTENH